MEVRIQGIHFDVSEKLAAFINKKAERLVRRYPTKEGIDLAIEAVERQLEKVKEAGRI